MVKSLQTRRWLRKKEIVERVSAFLKDETSTEKLALTVALGVVLGVFPILGLPTVLCGLAAFVCRLNFPALQLINYLAYPLQLALLWPFARFGAVLFGVSREWHGVWALSWIALRTTAAWLCFAVPAALILYGAIHRVVRWQRARTISLQS